MSPRAAGILLHPTSLPGRFGIGDLGLEAVRFLDWMAEAGQSLWQILPLGPAGHGHTPYTSHSSFAGDPMLISPERLAGAGLLPAAMLEHLPAFPSGRVDFPRVLSFKLRILREGWRSFENAPPRAARRRFEEFVEQPAQRGWLEDWSLFASLKALHGGEEWMEWDRGLARRDPGALAAARRDLAKEIAYHRFEQFVFFDQWSAVREAASARGIRILGDVPIYVAQDSADVWSRADLFDLDETGLPRHVAGVPPDYFSETGQLWGNPLYRWDRLEDEGFAWWIARMKANLAIADLVRLDHFRAFCSYWEVDASERTAERGRWVPGPGAKLLTAIRESLGALPVIAEDLGTITPDVHALREEFGLPGMKVLQFAFFEEGSSHHPRAHDEAYVVYTGTHDNDTTRGWFASLPPDARDRVLREVGGDGSDVVFRMIRAAYESPCEICVIPMQDVLELGPEARMNTPGEARGNWAWRMLPDRLGPATAERLRTLAEATGR